MRQEHPHKFDEDPHVHRGGWGGAGEGKALQASRTAEHLGGGQSGAGELDLRGRRQAVQIPVEIVMALERYVMTEGVPRYPRAYAWFRLVKLIALLGHAGNALQQVGDERPRTSGCSGEDQDHQGGEEGRGPARLHLGGRMAGGAQVAWGGLPAVEDQCSVGTSFCPTARAPVSSGPWASTTTRRR